MVTPEELAQRLKAVSVAELSARSGVSTKTIYRLRNLQHSPNLTTLRRLLEEIEAMRAAPVSSAAAPKTEVEAA